ncbi:ABC transporter ATP-binding protein [Granulicatella sp. 19428wC4_WM01]|nr:ABC transporter ATP-binding protein [Granulicatella sp. 19428wC4_WM01]MBF0780805.1 ABC transporter ATP-binding protein [Granulicatella sp. 19428wC4_WM01]TFU93821.1 ABC transporter ATP-binding protein [Granulicatella sp. WM01]
MENVIHLSNVYKKIRDGQVELTILDNLSLTIKRGEIVSIVGKSGAGKTTLLNILSFLDRSFQGDYLFNGQCVTQFHDKAYFKARLEMIGNIFQQYQLIPDLNVIQNVELPLGYRGIGRNKRKQLAEEAIALVGLKGREKTPVHRLSGGEQQRVAIARGIVFSPNILLADEPTGNLDEVTSRAIMDLLVFLNQEKQMTILIVTHDDEVAKRCHRVLRLEKGKVYDETQKMNY